MDVLTQFQTRNVLGAPLKTKDKITGVIEVVNKRQARFNEEDTRLLETLAAQAAIAIENTRLFQQSDLIAEMVHELRTPLASLTAAAYLLQRPDLPEDQRGKLGQTVYGEVRRLNDMASDFLDLSRLESGRVRMLREPVHLGGLVTECLEIIHPLADAEAIQIKTDIDKDVPSVHGDRNRLKQVVLNLLTNAIKYNTRGGQVVVRLFRQELDGCPGCARYRPGDSAGEPSSHLRSLLQGAGVGTINERNGPGPDHCQANRREPPWPYGARKLAGRGQHLQRLPAGWRARATGLSLHRPTPFARIASRSGSAADAASWVCRAGKRAASRKTANRAARRPARPARALARP